MAKLPSLIAALAKVDRRDRGVIENVARVIREAGYIPTGKRGGGAADMDWRSAANLLIALAAADSAKEAPLAIDRVRSLRREPGLWDAVEPNILHRIGQTDTFGDCLELLIEGVPELVADAASRIRGAWDDAEAQRLMFDLLKKGMGPIWIEVEISTRWADTRRRHGHRPDDVDWELRFSVDPMRYRQGFYGPSSDIVAKSSFGYPTLFAAWSAVSGLTDEAAEASDAA